MDMLVETDHVGETLHAAVKAHYPGGVRRREYLTARHDNQDWQLSFTVGPFDDIEFMLSRVDENERVRRVLSLFNDGTYSTSIHPANKDSMAPRLLMDIFGAVSR